MAQAGSQTSDGRMQALAAATTALNFAEFASVRLTFAVQHSLGKIVKNKIVLENFGSQLVTGTVDPVLSLFRENLARSASTECDEKVVNELVAKLSAEETEVLQKIIRAAVVKTAHYALWQAEQGRFSIIFEGMDVSSLSDGLSGELYLDDGWLKRFSRIG